MSETELLSSMIGDIYDAALDPALWSAVMERCAHFAGGSAAALAVKDAANGATTGVNQIYGFGYQAEYADSYRERYFKLNPFAAGLFFFAVGEIVSLADDLPYDELAETRFYKEWFRPQGWIDKASSVLEKSSTSYSVFSVYRHERDGMVDNACRRRMAQLVPHIRRAVLIGRTLELKKADAATLADALDGLAAGMFLVDAAGRLVHANARGHVMLGEATILRAGGGRLVANDPDADQALREALAAAAGDRGLDTQGIAVPLTGNGQPYLAHVLPLTSGHRRKAGAGHAAVAALFVRKAELDAPPAPEVIAKLYGLTPSELRVLLSVFDSGGVPNVAEALGISEATAKTHLRRLFEKTGTKRQADLVKLVAGFTAPDR